MSMTIDSKPVTSLALVRESDTHALVAPEQSEAVPVDTSELHDINFNDLNTDDYTVWQLMNTVRKEGKLSDEQLKEYEKQYNSLVTAQNYIRRLQLAYAARDDQLVRFIEHQISQSEREGVITPEQVDGIKTSRLRVGSLLSATAINQGISSEH